MTAVSELGCLLRKLLGIGVIEKLPFAALDSMVLRTGIELEPGRHPAHAGAHLPLGELFNDALESKRL